MRISKSIKFLLLALISVIGLVGCNHGVNDLVVTPKENSVPIGFQLQLKAETVTKKGKVKDVTSGEGVKWSSSDESIATIDSNGLISTKENTGKVTITAEGRFDKRDFKDTVFVNVTDAVMTSVTVTPKDESTPVGLTRNYAVTANFSNGQSIDVTQDNSTKWVSSVEVVSTISNEEGTKGRAKAVSIGETDITAYVDSENGQFSDTTTLTVTEAVPTSIVVSPNGKSVPVGLNEQLKATAYLSDGTNIDITELDSINWFSSDIKVATVSNEAGSKGLITGEAVGDVEIIASGEVNGLRVQGSANVEVIEAIIESLEIAPKSESVPVGLSKEFTATARLSDGQLVDVTKESAIHWSSSDSDIATISNSEVDKGTATGVSIGNVTITAYAEVNGEEIEATSTLVVTRSEAVTLIVTPKTQESLDTPQIPFGANKQFKAELVMTSGERIDVTQDDNLYWSSGDANIATISNSIGEKGLATGVGVGDVVISAKLLSEEYGELEDNAELTITPAHSLSFYVFTEKFSNVVQGEPVHYIGFGRRTMGRYWQLSGFEYSSWSMQLMYIDGGEGKPIEEHKFYFGQIDETPIAGALRYKATFDWPDGSSTEGILEWQFDQKHYVLIDPMPAENLLTEEWDFTLTVSNEGEF